jgi:outer membrane protein TolC
LQAGQVGIAKAAYLPTVILNASVSRGNISSSSNLQNTPTSSPTKGGTGSSRGQPINRLTPAISFNFLLYNFGAREAQLEDAQHTLEASN